jgi:hypothetical protein
VALSVSALAEQDVPFCAGESAERCLFVVSGQFLYQFLAWIANWKITIFHR